MAYKEFSEFKRTRTSSKLPMLRIQKNGTLRFNLKCQSFFENQKFAIFLFDKECNKIGIRPTNEDSYNVFNVRRGQKYNDISISATHFLRYYKIEFGQLRSLLCSFNETEKIIEVQL